MPGGQPGSGSGLSCSLIGHRNHISDLRRLPSSTVRPSPHSPPLTFARVCRKWREIAMERCPLWSPDIAFSRPRYYVPVWCGVDHGHLLEIWLSRAKGYPLSLTVRTPGGFIPSPVSSVISAYSGQFRCLELQTSDFPEIPTPLPLLQYLTISSNRQSSDEDLKSLFHKSPLLREIRLPPRSILSSPRRQNWKHR